MAEQIRLILFAVLLVGGLAVQITAAAGMNRFRFSVNRMHPAGMGDSLGLLLITQKDEMKTEAKEWKS